MAACGSWSNSKAKELSREEWLGRMLDREIAMRRQARQETARLSQAALREACIANIEFPRRAASTGATSWPKAND